MPKRGTSRQLLYTDLESTISPFFRQNHAHRYISVNEVMSLSLCIFFHSGEIFQGSTGMSSCKPCQKKPSPVITIFIGGYGCHSQSWVVYIGLWHCLTHGFRHLLRRWAKAGFGDLGREAEFGKVGAACAKRPVDYSTVCKLENCPFK